MISPPLPCPVCERQECLPFQRVGARRYWRCTHCLATFLEPDQRPGPEAEAREYLLHRNEVDDAGYRRYLQRLAAPLLDRLPPRQTGLDFGCGPGPALAAMLTEAGHQMALYDPLFRADPRVLEATYDFVTCTEVVEHFHRPAEEFARLDRLLRPGGWLAVMTRFLTDDAAFAGWHYRRDPTHVVFYRERTFQVIGDRFGWRCEFPGTDVALLRKPT